MKYHPNIWNTTIKISEQIYIIHNKLLWETEYKKSCRSQWKYFEIQVLHISIASSGNKESKGKSRSYQKQKLMYLVYNFLRFKHLLGLVIPHGFMVQRENSFSIQSKRCMVVILVPFEAALWTCRTSHKEWDRVVCFLQCSPWLCWTDSLDVLHSRPEE